MVVNACQEYTTKGMQTTGEPRSRKKHGCQRGAMKNSSSPADPTGSNEYDVQNMTAENIKAKLTEMGIRTRLRNVKRLQ